MRNPSIAAVLALVGLAAAGCVRPHGPEDVRRDLSRTTGTRLDREVGLTVTRSGIWLARMGLKIAGEEVPLRGIHRVEVGVYTVSGRREGAGAPDAMTGPALDLPGYADWTPIVRVDDGDNRALVLVRERGERIRSMLVVAIDDDEWVLVRLSGNLDRVVEQAMAFAFEEAGRSDLYHRSREERGLDPEPEETVSLESVDPRDAGACSWPGLDAELSR